MRKAGTESWRFAHDIDESLHCVLYLRHVLGLQIEDDGVIPPRLAGDVPDRSQVLGPASALAAAARWPSWWRAVVNQGAPTQLGPSSQQNGLQNWVREIATWHGPVFDPPEWASLEGSPALRDAARTLWIESCRWFGPAREPYLPPSCLDVFAWDQVRDAAERAADENEVSPGGGQRLRSSPARRGILVAHCRARCCAVLDRGRAGSRNCPGHPQGGVRLLPRRMRILNRCPVGWRVSRSATRRLGPVPSGDRLSAVVTQPFGGLALAGTIHLGHTAARKPLMLISRSIVALGPNPIPGFAAGRPRPCFTLETRPRVVSGLGARRPMRTRSMGNWHWKRASGALQSCRPRAAVVCHHRRCSRHTRRT